MSFWAIIFLGKCPSGQMSSGQMSFWANVFLVKFVLRDGRRDLADRGDGSERVAHSCLAADVLHLAPKKVRLLRDPFCQPASGQMSFWANVV
jgi:hypothetical protein